MSEWKKSESWIMRGNDFAIEVVHSTVPVFDERQGPHRWAVYAYVYESHPAFSELNDDKYSMFGNDFALCMPLHGGPSCYEFMELRNYGRKTRTIKIGCDYNHLHDDHHTFDDEPTQYLADAKRLFEFLNTAADRV